MHLVENSSCDEEEMTERYYDAFSPEEMNNLELIESCVGHESDDAERQVQEEEEETEEQYFDAYSYEELMRKKKTNNSLLTANFLKRNVGQELANRDCEESSADIWIPPNERNGPYFNLRISESHEDSHISKMSVNGDRYITDFDTFLAKETNSAKETELTVEQQSENRKSENSSIAVGMFSNQCEREIVDSQMSESQCEMYNRENASFGEQETFGGDRNTFESENTSCGEQDTFGGERNIFNPENSSFGEQRNLEEERFAFDHKLTESQDDTDNLENSSSVEEEEEKYIDLVLFPKESEKLPKYGQVTKQPTGIEPLIGEMIQTIAMQVAAYGNSFDLFKIYEKTLHKYGGDLHLICTKVDARYLRTVANCRVFVSIEENISPMSEPEQILFTIAMQVVAYGNSFDLIKIYGKTLHMYGGDLSLIRTKVNARYLRTVANCRGFVSIEENISQILFTVMVKALFCCISFGLTKSNYSAKSLQGCGRNVLQEEEHVKFPNYFVNIGVIISGNGVKCIDVYLSSIQNFEQKWQTALVIVAACNITFDLTKSGNSAKSLHDSEIGIHQEEKHVIFLFCFANFEVFGGFDAKLMQQADQSDFKSIAFVVVESRGMTNPAQYSLKEMSQEVGRYFTNNHKCSMQPQLIVQLTDIKCTMACKKNVISGRVLKVETYKEGVRKIQTFTKTSNLREKNVWTIDNGICVDNRCIGINTETSPNNPDDTNDARKYQGNEYKGFPHREVAEMHFEPFIACNKKVPSTSAQKKIVVILTIGDDICERNFEMPMDQKMKETPMECVKETNNKIRDQVNKLPDVSQKKQSLHEDRKLQTDAMQWNEGLNKVHNAFGQRNFEMPMDQKMKETPMECVKKTNNKIRDQVNKLPDVARKKQLLHEDRKLQTDAMQWNEGGKKTFKIKINFTVPFLFRLMLLLSFSLIVTSNSNVCKETVSKVPNCPTASEYQQRALSKCTGTCGDSEVKYEYHCVRDSTKTFLVELCAVSFYLFDYCVAYDEVGHVIQMDTSTRCNSSSKEPIYNSSDVFFCDPDSCLHLPTKATSLITSRTEPSSKTVITTQSTNSTYTNEGDIKTNQSDVWRYVAVSVIVLLIIIIIIIIFKYKMHKTKETSKNLFVPKLQDSKGFFRLGTSKNKDVEETNALNEDAIFVHT